MSKNLILIITIFAFWLFIYLSDVKKEQKAEDFKNNLADDGVKFASADTNTAIVKTFNTDSIPVNKVNSDGVFVVNKSSNRFIINPVKAKGEI